MICLIPVANVPNEVNHLDINSITFLAIIAPVASAIKVSGNNCGGTLLLAVDDTQLTPLISASLLREQLLRVTIEAVDD